ncbi:orotate phosphoribosyltransferase [Christensenellaceae bacterium NSJ-63]|uniref:Orotate phosphoribosyltransferase n=1 Tax=Guopingia tenuis TaxID=2763656 RepID=A0A926HSM4_9FIRM|nr:orotate phosphoribosyltransferase [Guopingia tenuis]MBC8538607.1 orotate phosphoribosyltransferase [Guopingia tenuis]
MLTKEQVLAILKEREAVLEGHFLLTSGRHSDRYVQCAKLFQYADTSEIICKELAEKFEGEKIDVVVGPALGGVIMAYEMGRQLGVRNIFAERENGNMTLRRGFKVERGERVLVCEDVVTTGGSVKEVIALLSDMGAEIVGVGSVVDRSNGKVDFGVPFHAVLSMEVTSYEADNCPLCKEGKIPAIKPGSRNLTK